MTLTGNNSSGVVSFGEFSGVLEDVSCPICDYPPNPRLIFQGFNRVRFWQCPQCDVMYASPRFTEGSLLAIYENEAFIAASFYEDWSYEKWKAENKDRSYIVQDLKVQLVRRFLSEDDRILDVGCGTGLFCLEASKQGFNVEGIDPSSMLVELGSRLFKVSLYHGQLEGFDPGYKYKGIVLWAVLEHVYNLKDLIKRCGHLLDAGGYLFIDVPNHRGPSNQFKTLLCRLGIKKADFKHFGFPWHIYSFNKRSLSLLMRACGFEPVFFEFWSHYLKDGANGILARMVISLTHKYELSDYLTLVAQKR